METTKTKKEIAFERRNALKDLCKQLKMLVEMGQIITEAETMNDLLRDYYASAGHKELHTFKEWKEKGYFVKKGEKAILLWARPKATKKAKQQAEEAGKDGEKAKEDYFPLAYVFSEKQVQKA